MTPTIVFTDLDGTLLNHHTYEYEAVLPLIERLKTLDIPVVLNSSKTLSELQIWQQRLHLDTPMVAENGGVIQFVEAGHPVETTLIGRPYDEIRSFIKHLRKVHGWHFEGFGDWTVAEVMNHTQLASSDAVLAKERHVTEPILWMDSEENLNAFKAALEGEELTLKKGGRFYHVMGKHDKSDAMTYLQSRSDWKTGTHHHIIALGDGGNDLAMLHAADTAIVMPNATGGYLEVENALRATEEAPLGWVSSIEAVLTKN